MDTRRDIHVPPGYRLVFCMSFVHYITKMRVYRRDGKPFAFLVRV